jgi:2-polyprenyl-3-methyl-5-hydroxy-6-metoxy-1,4-benzoquinol methylase
MTRFKNTRLRLREITSKNRDLEYVGCNLCGNDEPSFILEKFGLFIVKCNHCSLVYANPRLIPSLVLKRYSRDYLINEYLPTLGVSENKIDLEPFRLRYHRLLEVLDRHKKNSNLLDVGCGPGFFLKVSEERGWRSKGIDISSSAVEFGAKLLGLDLCCGSLEEMSFQDSSFDVILFQDVIEHLFNPMATLRETYRILRPGGAIFISTPNLRSLMHHLLGKHWAILSPAEHLFYFTHETLLRMLREIGYSRITALDILLSLTPSNSHFPEGFRTKTATRLVKPFLNTGFLYFFWLMGMNDYLNVIAEK